MKIPPSLLILFLIMFLVCPVRADTTYIIKKHDNPSTIAKNFGVTARDIIELNDLNPRRLKPGMQIMIPVAHVEVIHDEINEENRTSVTTQGEKTLSPVGYKNHTHIVKKGDTLLKLARTYSVTAAALKEINHLSSSKIVIGQELMITQADPLVYRVRKGDSLSAIARKFDTTVHTLRELNSLDTDTIRPGETLQVSHLNEPETSYKNYKAILSQGTSSDFSEADTAQSIQNEPGLRQTLVRVAKQLLNIPYRFGGNSHLGIDCSAFVQKAYRIIGIHLPRSAREQFTEGDPVEKTDLSIGDLVFFRTYAPFPSHVGIYLGDNLFIHASSQRKKVTIDRLDTPYFYKRFIGAKRLLDKNGKTGLQDES
jgi:cell wall-associated NlpC family hydrolase